MEPDPWQTAAPSWGGKLWRRVRNQKPQRKQPEVLANNSKRDTAFICKYGSPWRDLTFFFFFCDLGSWSLGEFRLGFPMRLLRGCEISGEVGLLLCTGARCRPTSFLQRGRRLLLIFILITAETSLSAGLSSWSSVLCRSRGAGFFSWALWVPLHCYPGYCKLMLQSLVPAYCGGYLLSALKTPFVSALGSICGISETMFQSTF